MLATDNPHKQEKLRWVVEKYFKQIEVPTKPLKIKEVGNTFEEIARKKAIEASKNFDGFIIATDAGMEIPGLTNWNSLLTKRFVGNKMATDFDRMDALLELTKNLKDRRMQWKEAVAVTYKGKIVFSTTVSGAKGLLQKSYDKSKYKAGIWLCSLWYFPTYKRNFFDLKPQEVTFAEVSWLRLKKEIEKFFSTPLLIRDEQKTALRDIKLEPAITLENWPHDPLMDFIKQKVRTHLKPDFLVDNHDLEYQVLFRLTTFRLEELFNARVANYLRRLRVFDRWENLLKVNINILEKHPINEDLIKEIIREQSEVAKLRLKTAKLPLENILKPNHKIFLEKGWVIQKINGDIFAQRGKNTVELKFRQVPKRYAEELHSKLHYIHCPRVERAFGLFLKGEKIPFSVLAVQKIDREYKKRAVLLKGFDYRKVVDFTRLYSFNGSPMNTSSVMFALTRDYLRKKTDIQACLSAFMPSYANGMSMFAGGLDNVLIAKPLSHTFERIPGTNLYKHVVKRLEDSSNEDFVHSKIPLLPTLELLSKITEPPLSEIKGISGKMIVF